MKNKVLLIFFVFCSNVLYANSDYFFTTIDGNNGLSQNHVKSILQDSRGFMWFGTRNQLNRFDGLSIKTFNCFDYKAMKGNNNISALCELPDGKLCIGTDEGVYLFDPQYEKFMFVNQKTSNGIVMTQWVSDIQMDKDENIWIVIPNQGVFKFSIHSKTLKFYTVVEKLMPSISNPQCITIEKNGRVWIGTNRSGLYLYNKSDDNFTQYLGNSNGNNSLLGIDIYTICNYEDDILIGATEGKLMKLNKKRNELHNFVFTEANKKIIRHINVLNTNEIWVGTEDGLYIFNEKKHTVEHLTKDPINKYSLSDNVIEKIQTDREGGIWIGTNFGGISYFPSRNNTFEQFIPVSKKNSISSKRFREIHEDKKGNIWIGSEDAGIDMFNPATMTFSQIHNLQYKKTLGLFVQDSKVWVGYFKNGLDIIHTDHNNSVEHFNGKKLGLNEASIYTICEDRFGKIWLGNAWGVFVAEKGTMKFTRMDCFGLIFTYDIIEDSEGYIWIATMGSGVFQYDQRKKKMTHYISNNKINSLSSNSVSSITEDHSGKIWFSTDRGGICNFNKRTSSFTSYSIKEGLPDDVAYKIIEDKQNNLWFGTNKGLVRFNPETKLIKTFTKNDGLISNQFNYKSGFISSTGKLYFGYIDGLLAFNPEEFKENQYIPPVFITKLTIHNKEIILDSIHSVLRKSILFTKKIELSYDQSTLSFDFAALSYTAPLANTYKYKMENIDKDWIITKNNHSASYAKLPPGNYVFKVLGSNNDGLWNKTGTSIEIKILPPWWASSIAYLLYFTLFCLAAYWIVTYLIQKSRNKNKEKQRLFEIEKEKELYESKLDFFTNIAHEIRTPVTLINGPLESILDMQIQDKDVKHNLSIIEQNTKNLLNLINQLLDFRKVDSNKISLKYSKIDVCLLFNEIKDRFNQTMNIKGKSMDIKISKSPIIAWIDKEEFIKILNNLFSNAIKYSDLKIDVELTCDEQCFTIIFNNDGDLIPNELSEKIFEPFFQVKSNNLGSGIGLSLARSLAELHNGSLEFISNNGINTFILKLPLSHEANNLQNDDLAANTIQHFEALNEFVPNNTFLEHILIVEDNIDLLNFVAENLHKNYNVDIAVNGKDAMNILKTKPVDIIVCDIMMPEMDGFEFCKIVKSNIEYCHIIFIILTAKNDLNSKIQGLELGADAYVEKPFSFHYLNTLLSSLLSKKKREKELYLQKPFIPIQQVSMNKADAQFMDAIIEIINENLTDSDFNVEKLAELALISRSSLHRKFKSLVDLSPTDFIRLIRLKKAAQLIKENGYRVNEVCYLVGINSQSYFIKLFQKQFGMTPKEFEKHDFNL